MLEDIIRLRGNKKAYNKVDSMIPIIRKHKM